MDFYRTVCRLCETPDQIGYRWVELYSDNSEPLLAKIRTCANIELSDSDGLPKRICRRCWKTVERAYNFKMQCELTDAKLRHEIGFLNEQGKNPGELAIPPFDYAKFLSAQDGPKQDVILSAEKVYVKADPDEDENLEGSTTAAMVAVDDPPPLDFELDWGPNDDKNSRASERSDSDEDYFLVEKIEKPKTRAKKPPAEVKQEVHGSSAEESDSEDDQPTDENTNSSEESKEKGIAKKQNYVCDICGAEFDTRRRFRYHKQMKHLNIRFKCTECPKDFSKKLYLKDHMARHKGVRAYECPKCDRKYFTHSGYRAHLADHRTDLPFECEKCACTFANESKLRIHYTIHIETRDCICEVCNKGFKTPANLRQHKKCHLPKEQQPQKKKRPPRTKQYMCQYCGKVSMHHGAHNMHVRTHTGDQPFECHICQRRFASEAGHRKHLLVHTGEKPYVCQYCQKAFRQKHHMDSHIRGIHTKETPYKCKFCPRGFATLGNMREHEKKSHGGTGRSAATASAMASRDFGHFLAETTEYNDMSDEQSQ